MRHSSCWICHSSC